MPSLAVLYSTGLTEYAVRKLSEDFLENKTIVHLAIEHALLLPEVSKLLILIEEKDKEQVSKITQAFSDDQIEIEVLPSMTAFNILSICAKKSADIQDVFISPLEAPFVDVKATAKLFQQHKKYKAEYSFAEGYPEFLFPQVLNSGMCAILSSFVKDDNSIISHSFIFDIIKKDINSYDIETLVAPQDARMLKLKLLVETKRDLMLCNQFAGITAENYIDFLENAPLKSKTLPRYYMLELYPEHIKRPIYAPPQIENSMPIKAEDFYTIIEKISQFSDDAIISLSIYGEPLLHENFTQFVQKILSHKNLSILVETHGTCKDAREKITAIKDMVLNEPIRPCNTPPLYWITDIDATTATTYAKVYDAEEKEAETLLKQAYETAEYAMAVFASNAYVQFVRMNENENDLEGFYRSWKERGAQVIIQKYDHFCKVLPDRRVADLSPLYRMPCRHLPREMCICSNGDVLLCREDVQRKHIMGNVLKEDMSEIWKRFDDILNAHIKAEKLNEVGGLCELCDEYYTYNF